MFYHNSTCFLFTLQIILCHYFRFVNKCLLKFWIQSVILVQEYALKQIEQASTHIPKKLFPWPLDLGGVQYMWETFFSPRSIKRIRTCSTVNLTFPYYWWGESHDLQSDYLPFDPVTQLQSFTVFQTKPETQSYPGTLSSRASISLMSRGIS